MGIDVVLMEVSQKGTSSKGRRHTVLEMVTDGDDLFSDLCQNSNKPMLGGRAKPYGDLVLKSTQMEQFIEEVSFLRSEGNDYVKDRMDKILSLARRCQVTAGTELHLQGD